VSEPRAVATGPITRLPINEISQLAFMIRSLPLAVLTLFVYNRTEMFRITNKLGLYSTFGGNLSCEDQFAFWLCSF